MSMLQFIQTPFPDNHDGFDYAPKSFTDVQHELDAQIVDAKNKQQQNKMLSMLTSIFK